ncbi:MAG: nucleotidyltransferase domain-containing protein, partial [Anaerolineae bacterium]
ALLFGSRARGEAKPDSDMDVLLVMSRADPEVRKEIRYLAVELWLEHDIYLSTRVWSQAHWRKLEELQTLLYRNIRQDGINLLDPSPAPADSK